jgi:predicted nucleic acid-binding protein
MLSYADTSFLLSLYVVDGNSAAARSIVSSQFFEFAWTPLHSLEMRSALAQAVFRQAIPNADAIRVWQDVMTDLHHRRLTKVSVDWLLALRLASWHSRRRTGIIGCRSLDVLHVACASVLGVREFFSFDNRQRNLASALKFTVRP